jgi:hypothetical protein
MRKMICQYPCSPDYRLTCLELPDWDEYPIAMKRVHA